MDIGEKKERIVQSYQHSFDKDMAYMSMGVSEEERLFLEQDEAFQNRLSIVLMQEKERIISKLRGFMDCEDIKISFQATTDLGKILYPEFFKRLTPPVNVKVSKELSEEEEERIRKEYELLLGSGRVKKEPTDSES